LSNGTYTYRLGRLGHTPPPPLRRLCQAKAVRGLPEVIVTKDYKIYLTLDESVNGSNQTDDSKKTDIRFQE